MLLTDLPNVGLKLAENLRRVGLETPRISEKRGPGRPFSVSGPRWTPRPASISSPPWPGRSWAFQRKRFPQRKRRS